MHDMIGFGLVLAAILAGILLNNKGLDKSRQGWTGCKPIFPNSIGASASTEARLDNIEKRVG